MENETLFDITAYTGLAKSAAIFGVSLMDKILLYPEIMVLSSDVSVQANLDRFKYQYPENFINVGIAEQNLIGIASGLASEGHKSIAVAQATFISMRCFEQVRQYLSYMQNNVILVGISAGFLLQHMGNTHYALEDVSLMRSIPGLIVLSPADAAEAVKAFETALESKKPVYIRLSGESLSTNIYEQDFPFIIGKSNIIHDGDDITVFATGSMVYPAIKATEIIEEQGISVKLVNVHTISPIDREVINESKNSRLFVSVEEHYLSGGLGTSIAEHISSSSGFPPLLRLGVNNSYSLPGDYNYLLEQNRLTPKLIAEDILNRLK